MRSGGLGNVAEALGDVLARLVGVAQHGLDGQKRGPVHLARSPALAPPRPRRREPGARALRDEIALELGLIDQDEIKLPEPQRYGIALIRASERDLLDRLEKLVAERE